MCVCVWAFPFQITWLTCLGQVGLQDASAQNSGRSWCAHICGTGGLECSGKMIAMCGILVGQLGNQRNQWSMQEIAGVHPAATHVLQSVPRFEGNPTAWSSSMKWKRHTPTSSTSCASVVDWWGSPMRSPGISMDAAWCSTGSSNLYSPSSGTRKCVDPIWSDTKPELPRGYLI